MTAQKTTVTIPYATLNTFLSVIAALDSEARLHVEENKLHVSLVDTANVALIEMDTTECKTTGASATIGIDVITLKKVLMHAKGCNVTIEIAGDNQIIKYGRFSAKVKEIDANAIRKDANPPTIELPVTFETPSKYLIEALKVGTNKSKCYLFTKKGVVFFSVETDTMCIREIIGETKSRLAVKSQYNTAYMKEFLKTVFGCSLNICINQDHPVKITTEKDGCNIMFLLAPRIEND